MKKFVLAHAGRAIAAWFFAKHRRGTRRCSDGCTAWSRSACRSSTTTRR